MSLLRLLSAGKSLVGLKDDTARYRMGHPGAMPKFGSGKNPFQTKSQTQPSVEAPATTPSSNAPNSPEVVPVREEEKKSLPAVVIPPLKTQPRPAPRNGSRFGSVLQVALRPLKSLFQRPRSKSVRPPKTQSLRTPVQAELSLDCVKVLRNDLTDADLEVVRAKTPASATAKPEPIQAPPETPEQTQQYNLETKTNRVANGFAGAGKT
jgi:hypothetical protein